MAAPDYVPRPVSDEPRIYQSPPWRPESWMADRPAELDGPQPLGARLGTPGPDQGYALRLVRNFSDRLVLNGDSADDVVAGCVALAMRRAGAFGRGPIVHDLTVAFTLYGYLENVPADLAAKRSKVFASVDGLHHYMERRAIVDVVPEELLRLSPDAVKAAVGDDPSIRVALVDAALASQHHDEAVH